MGNILNMQEHRAKLRAQRRLARDLEDCSQHPAMDHHPTWVPTKGPDAPVDTIDEKARRAWAYGPEGLSGSEGDRGAGAGMKKGELYVITSAMGVGKARTQDYLDHIIDRAYNGSEWAGFRLALLQLRDEAPGLARETMQLTFPEMDPVKFELWLDRAMDEFDEYSDQLERDLD